MADSSGWLSLLISGQRKIERIRDDRVTARSLCRGSDFHESPIEWVARHLGHPFAYLPPCRGRPSGA